MSLKKTDSVSSDNSAKKPSVKPSVKPLQLRQSRTFSTLLIQQLVSDLDYKRTTIREVCQQYQVSPKTVYQAQSCLLGAIYSSNLSLRRAYAWFCPANYTRTSFSTKSYRYYNLLIDYVLTDINHSGCRTSPTCA